MKEVPRNTLNVRGMSLTYNAGQLMNNFSKELAIALLDSDQEFPVDFDDAWQWLGYVFKSDCLIALKNSFEENEDYLITRLNKNDNNRYNSHRSYIFLTVDCFFSLGRIAGTSQANQCINILSSISDSPGKLKKSLLTDCN
ncbi:MAG TPA: hypothetical protein V6D21_19270 [Candidatus Obscuribacterales bacterium]